MAHHKDAIKRMKQNEKRRLRGRDYRSRMRSKIKKVRAAVAAGDATAAQTELLGATSIIQRLVTKGIIHRNQAARRIARLNKAVKTLAAG